LLDQILILLALSAGLFDPVSLDRMAAAQLALRTAAVHLPADLRARAAGVEKLIDADKAALLELAGKTLAPFHESTP
jgi:F-type H+-transporting ATPase subunit alpha